MNEAELASYIGSKVNSAMNRGGDGLSEERIDILARYRGRPYGNEQEGQSKVTTREVMETVEWALPAILKVFVSGDKVVAFNPVGPDDEEAAEQETAIVNHHLLKKNNGFMAFYEWFKSALMHTNGYAKMWMDETECMETERYEGLLMEEVAMLSEEDGVELTEASEYNGYYDITLKRTYTKKQLTFEAVPGNEVLIDDDLTSLDMDECEFVCHEVERTYSWLVKNGYDKAKLDAISADDIDDTEDYARREDSQDSGGQDHDSLRTYKVHECSLLVDYDDDGIAERRRVVEIGGEIFENEEDSYQPFIALGSSPMPHSHESISLGEMVEDLQEIRTTLVRQMLTNIYRINQPRTYVGAAARDSGGITMDTLLDGYSEYVPCEDPTAIVPEVIQPLGGVILPILQEFSQIQQTRTGIAPQLTLDPNVLQQSTAGAFAGALQQANQRLELITRVFAETGVRQAMQKAHRLLRTYQDKEDIAKISGKWVPYAPSHWRDRDDLTINVGLGFGSAAETIAQVMQVIQMQMQLQPQGFVDEQGLYNSLEKLVESSSLKSVERFFTKPSENQAFIQAQQAAAQQPPDPLTQAQASALQADAQSKIMREQNKQQELAMNAQRDAAKMQAEQREKDRQYALEEFNAMSEEQRKKFKDQLEAAASRATVGLTEAKRIKTMEEARALDMDNDATETGVITALEGMSNAN